MVSAWVKLIRIPFIQLTDVILMHALFYREDRYCTSHTPFATLKMEER